jgi:hypothetical protein
VIHPPHLTLYAIVTATTCGASLVFLVFVSLYSIAGVLVHLMRRVRERGEGRRDLKPEKAHRLTTAGNQRIDFRELSAADFEAFWRVRALSTPIANGLGDAAKGVAAVEVFLAKQA